MLRKLKWVEVDPSKVTATESMRVVVVGHEGALDKMKPTRYPVYVTETRRFFTARRGVWPLRRASWRA